MLSETHNQSQWEGDLTFISNVIKVLLIFQKKLVIQDRLT